MKYDNLFLKTIWMERVGPIAEHVIACAGGVALKGLISYSET